MRAAVAMCLWLATACAAHNGSLRSLSAPAPPPKAPPLRLAVLDAGDDREHTVVWTPELALAAQREDLGAFVYATRRTPLLLDPSGARGSIGWLEPGARVGVASVKPAYVEALLFAWRGASDAPLRAWVRAADVDAAPPAAAPRPEPDGKGRLVAAGQRLSRRDGSELGYTFCGPLEVREETGAGAEVVQREDGVALQATLDPRAIWSEKGCPGLLLVEGLSGRSLVRNGRARPYAGQSLPPGLVAEGRFAGPTFAELVKRRAVIQWLVDDDERGPACNAWQAKPGPAGHDGELVSRLRLADGDTLVSRFGLVYGDTPDTQVTLLGPSSEVIAPPGKAPQSGGVSFACGTTYQIVASEVGVLTVLTQAPPMGGRVLAYDPRDTERWYVDRARCEKEAARLRQVRAHGMLAFRLHEGC